MMRLVIRAVRATLFLYGIAISAAAAQERPSITIGAVLPMTGAMASVGGAMQRGMTMAASDTNYITAQIVIEDDRTANRMSAVNAVKKLTDIDKAAIIFSAYASTVSAFSSILTVSDVSCLVLWDSNRALQKLGKTIFGFGYENELAGEDMASFAYEHLGRKTVGFLLEDEVGGVRSQP